jgi:hypothetical protein
MLQLLFRSQSLVSSFGLLSVDDHSVGLTGLAATSTVGSLSPADAIGISGLSARHFYWIFNYYIKSYSYLICVITINNNIRNSYSYSRNYSCTNRSKHNCSLGTVTTVQVTNANLDGLGLTATTTLNDNLILRYYQRLTPKTSSGYTNITPKTSSSYTRITPKTSTGYTRKTP